MALTTLDDVLKYRLGNGEVLKTTPDQNDVLKSIIDSISTSIEKYCSRTFLSTSYTEYYNGDGRSILYLKNYPIISITSIHEDDNWVWDSSTLISTSYYRTFDDLGIIFKDGTRLDTGRLNIKVVYVAGFTTIPSDIQNVAIVESIRMFDNMKTLNLSSRSENNSTTSYIIDGFLPKSKSVLNLYKLKDVV